MGFGWPSSPLLFVTIVLVLVGTLFFHCRSLIRSAPAKIVFRLILLRITALLFLLLLFVRPFLEQEELDRSNSVCSHDSVSGSMEIRDEREGEKRIDGVRTHFDSLDGSSWINRQGKTMERSMCLLFRRKSV